MKAALEKFGSVLTDSIQTITIALSVWLLAYLFLGHGTQIYGSSMEPTFHDKECVFTDIVSYKFTKPARGDVISLHAPTAARCATGTGCDLFKRIIGLPGEDVSVTDNAFYINGERLIEEYIPSSIQTLPGPYMEQGPVRLRESEYFVAGDNREHSSDSRFFGPIERSDIIGRAILRYCPSSAMGLILAPEYE